MRDNGLPQGTTVRGKRKRVRKVCHIEILEPRHLLAFADLWVGGQNGGFNVGANWSLGVAPINAGLNKYSAIFDAGQAPVTVVMDVNNAETETFLVESGAVTLQLAGNAYTVGDLDVVSSPRQGPVTAASLTVQDGSLVATSVKVRDISANAALTIQKSTRATTFTTKETGVGWDRIAAGTTTSTMSLIGLDSAQLGTVGVGFAADVGALTLSNDQTVTSDMVNIGWGGESKGTVSVTNGTVFSTQAITVGKNGIGDLQIDHSTVNSYGLQAVGYDAQAVGTVEIRNQGHWGIWQKENTQFAFAGTNGGGLEIGRRGTGTITMSSGADLNVHSYMSIGGILPLPLDTTQIVFAACDGQLVMDHATCESEGLFLATTADGEGTLDIGAGGIVSTTFAHVAENNGEGYVNVSGNGAALNIKEELIVGELGIGSVGEQNGGIVSVTGEAIVGNGGEGYLLVRKSAQFEAAQLVVGYGTDSQGDVTVNGGEVKVGSGGIIVGEYGKAKVSLYGGAQVRIQTELTDNLRNVVGEFGGSQGKVSVSGSGTKLTINSGLTVGLAGAGSLSIADHATVSSSFGDVAFANGGSGNVDVGAGGTWQITTGQLTSNWGNALGQSTSEIYVHDGGKITSAGNIDVSKDAGGNPTAKVKLRGNGSITDARGPINSNAATIIPGTDAAAVGTLTFDGALNALGSAFDEDVATAAAVGAFGLSDLVDVTGQATIGGDLVVSSIVGSATSYVAGDEFDLLHADGGIAGTFAEVNTSDAPLASGLQWQVDYNESGTGEVTDVVLEVVPTTAPVVYSLEPTVTAPNAASSGITLSASAFEIGDNQQLQNGPPPGVSQIASVAFYRSTDSTIYSLQDATFVGDGIRTNDGIGAVEGEWTYTIANASFLSQQTPETLLAVATDIYGQQSAAAYVTLTPVLENGVWNGQFAYNPENPSGLATVNVNPSISDGLAVTPTASSSPLDSTIELSAQGVTGANGGQAQSVTYYMAPTGSGIGFLTEIGAVTGSTNGDWGLDINATALSGSYTFWALAIGADGQRSAWAATSVNFNRPSVYLYANTSVDSSGTPWLDLSAGIGATGSGATITGVSYYIDTSGIGPFSPTDADAKLLGTATSAGANGNWAVGSIDLSEFSGTETIYAVATNSVGWQSAPAMATINVNQPVISSLTASTDDSSGAPQLMLTANGVDDAVGDVTNVEFYQAPAGATSLNQAADTDLGGDDGSNGWSIDVSPQLLSGPETFFAVAIDGTYSSVPVSTTVQPVVVGQASASFNDLYFNGQATTLTASGLLDWNGGATVTGVDFYPAASDGSFTTSTTPLAAAPDGNGNWNAPVTPSGWSGEQTYYAVATDSAGAQSNPVAIVLDPHQAPTVDSVTATTDTTTGAHFISLAANGVDDGSQVASVAFYEVGAGTGGADLLLGTVDAPPEGGTPTWTLDGIDASGFGASQQFYSVVTNDAGQTTQSPTLTVAGMTVGDVSADPGQYVAGSSFTLTASGILDFGGGSGQTVQFYQDTSGTGDFTQATAIGSPQAVSGGSASYTVSDTSSWSGPQIFFAQASDAGNAQSAVQEFVVYPDQAPTLDSLSAVSDAAGGDAGPTLDLTANGAFDLDGTVDHVEFYVAPAGSTSTSITGATDLGSASDSTNWTLPNVSGSYLSAGPRTFFAIATDDDGAASAPVTLALNPVTVDYLMANLDEYVAGDSLTLTAGGINDWISGSSPTSVELFRDPTGQGNFANATSIGTSDAADDWSLPITSTSGWTGPQVFFAEATDGTWTSVPVELVVNPDQPPTIGGLSPTIDSSSGSPRLTLTANNVQADGWVQTVNFYTYSPYGVYNSSNLIGSDDGTNGWSLSGVDVTSLTGPQEYVAIATDNLGVQSAPAIATYSPQKLYWDPSGNVGSSVDVVSGNGLGGSGVWNPSDSNTLNWFNSTTGALQAWNNAADEIAVFEGSGGEVTLESSATANSILFVSSGYTIDGGNSVAMEGAGQIDVAAGATANIDDGISGGVNGVSKTGAGELVLGNSNSSGTDWNIALADGIVDAGGGVVSITSYSGGSAAVESNATLVVSGFGSLDVTLNGGSLQIESGQVNVSGSNEVAYSIENDGTLYVSGSLEVQNGISNGGGEVIVASGGNLSVDSGGIDGGSLDNYGMLSFYAWNSEMSLSASLLNYGSVAVEGGELNISGAITNAGGIYGASGATLNLSISDLNNANGEIYANGGFDISGNLDNSNGQIEMQWGTLSVGGSTTNYGGLIENFNYNNYDYEDGLYFDGYVDNSDGNIWGGNGTLSVADGLYNTGGTITTWAGSLSISGEIENAGGTIVAGNNQGGGGGYLSLSGDVDNTGGQINGGNAVVNLWGSLNNSDGTLDVGGGNLNFSQLNNVAGHIYVGEVSYSYNNGSHGASMWGDIDNEEGDIDVDGILYLGGNLDNSGGNIQVDDYNSYALYFNGSLTNADGNISGPMYLSLSGGLDNEGGTINGGGNVSIGGDLDNVGGQINLQWGALSFGDANNVGGSIQVGDYGTVYLGSGATIAGGLQADFVVAYGADRLTYGDGADVTVSGSLGFNDANGTLSVVFNGAGAIDVNGGTVDLVTAYYGDEATVHAGGTLSVNWSTDLGEVSLDGGTLLLYGSVSTSDEANSGSVTVQYGTLIVNGTCSAGLDVTLNGGSLVVNSGTVNLSSDSYANSITVNSGGCFLVVEGSDSFVAVTLYGPVRLRLTVERSASPQNPYDGDITLEESATLDLNGENYGSEITVIDFGGAITNSSGMSATFAGDIENAGYGGTLYIGGNAGSITLTGEVENNDGALYKWGTDKLTLSNENYQLGSLYNGYGGTLDIAANLQVYEVYNYGSLEVSGELQLGNGASNYGFVQIDWDATLYVGGDGISGGTWLNNGSVYFVGGGSQTLPESFVNNNDICVTYGTLHLSGEINGCGWYFTTGYEGFIELDNGLSMNGGGIDGWNGAVQVDGAVSLTGATISGYISVNNGTLNLTSDSINDGFLDVESGGTVVVNGGNVWNGQVWLDGGQIVVKAGSMEVEGNGGGATVNNGATLVLGNYCGIYATVNTGGTLISYSYDDPNITLNGGSLVVADYTTAILNGMSSGGNVELDGGWLYNYQSGCTLNITTDSAGGTVIDGGALIVNSTNGGVLNVELDVESIDVKSGAVVNLTDSYDGYATVETGGTLYVSLPSSNDWEYVYAKLAGGSLIIDSGTVYANYGCTGGNLTVESGGIFDLDGNSVTLNSLSDGGTSGGVINDTCWWNDTLTVGAGNGSSTFNGIIEGGEYGNALTLDKIGSGSLTLGGANSFDALIVDGGTVTLGSSSAIGSNTVLTINAGSFDLHGYNATVASLSGSGGVVTNALHGTSSTITVGGNNQSTSFYGRLTGNVGSLTLDKIGSGVFGVGGLYYVNLIIGSGGITFV